MPLIDAILSTRCARGDLFLAHRDQIHGCNLLILRMNETNFKPHTNPSNRRIIPSDSPLTLLIMSMTFSISLSVIISDMR